jgi:adenylylsulfate kinase-like enzyme
MHFTGIDSSYQAPQAPDIHVAGLEETPEAATARIVDWFFTHQGRAP